MNTRTVNGVRLQSAKTPYDETRSLYHFLGILRNRRWFLAGVVGTCLLIALVATFIFPHEYRAKATIQIEPERTDFYEGWRATGTLAEYRTNYLTLLKTLNSNGLARRVIEDLNLWEHKEFSPVWKRALGLIEKENFVIETFRERIGVSTVSGSMLIDVQFAANDPKLASTVANALVNRFISEYDEFMHQLTVHAADWMSSKLPELNDSLEKAQQRADAFRREHNLVEVEGRLNRLSELELSSANQDLSQVSLELEQTRSALQEAITIFEDMSDPTDTGERLKSLDIISSDPNVQLAWFHRNSALNHRQVLSTRYGPKHPFMVDATARIASFDAEIAEQIDRIMTTTVMRVASLTSQLSNSQSLVEDNKQDMMSLQEKRIKLRSMENEVVIQRSLVNQFYTDTLAARSLEGFNLAGAIVVDHATAPLQPYRPQRAVVLMLVALSTSIFSVLFVFFFEHVDDKIRNTKDVSRKLQMGLLGMIPEFASSGVEIDSRKLLDTTSMYAQNEVFAEAVNNVRTMLMTLSLRRARDSSVLLVTASQTGEGSTTTAVSLAHSFSRLERVLLIDCHLRRPAIARLSTDIDANVGLNSVIAGTTSIENSVHRDALGSKFDVMVCALDVASSTTILASSEFEQMLDRLREQYKWIILDAAPTHQDSSSLLLGKLADAVIYVVRSHSTGLTTIKRGISGLRAAGGHIAGVLINRVDSSRIVSHSGDYDYASYCGDISYKDKSDLDLVRETLYAGADRACMAYRKLDTASKWEIVKSKLSVVAQLTRKAYGKILGLDMAGLNQRLVHTKDSISNVAQSAVALCRRTDVSGLRQITESYQRTIMSMASQISTRTRWMVENKPAPLPTGASRTFRHLRDKNTRRVEYMNLQPTQASDDRKTDQERAENNWSELMSYYMPKDIQVGGDNSTASNQRNVHKRAVAKI